MGDPISAVLLVCYLWPRHGPTCANARGLCSGYGGWYSIVQHCSSYIVLLNSKNGQGVANLWKENVAALRVEACNLTRDSLHELFQPSTLHAI